MRQPIRWHFITFVAIIFYVVYTGGSCNNASRDMEAEIVAECQRQLKGTQGYIYCACGNRKDCR